MKNLLVLILFFLSLQAQSQFMAISSAQATTVSGGINVNLQTATGHGAGFISHSYTVTGTIIELTVCYWFDNTLPILYFNHDFFIPLSASTNYTVNVHIMMSQSMTVCDNFANPANATIQGNYMSTDKNSWSNAVKIYPNPSTGIIYFEGLDAKINRVEVFDVSGKSVLVHENFAGNKLELSELQNGIYFVKLETEKGFLNRKMVLKR